MATVGKDFVIKEGLRVLGENASVDGSDIITAQRLVDGEHVGISAAYDANTKALVLTVDAGDAAIDVVAQALRVGTNVDDPDYVGDVDEPTNITVTYTEEVLDNDGVTVVTPASIRLEAAPGYTDEEAKAAIAAALKSASVLRYDEDGKFDVVIAADKGLEKVDGVDFVLDADGNATAAAQKELAVKAGNGITVDASGVGVKLDENGTTTFSGLAVDADGISAKLKADNGLDVDADGLSVKIEADKGITVGASGLALEAGNGIVVDADGISVDVGNGLEIATDKVQVKLDTDSGLELDADGISVKTGAGITKDADGIKLDTPGNGLELDTNGKMSIDDAVVVTVDGTQTLTNKTLGSVDGGTFLGADLDAGEFKITNLAAPEAQDDAATKAYVDSVAEGLHVHESVVAATVGDITLAGTSVPASRTASSDGLGILGPQGADPLVDGQRYVTTSFTGGLLTVTINSDLDAAEVFSVDGLTLVGGLEAGDTVVLNNQSLDLGLGIAPSDVNDPEDGVNLKINAFDSVAKTITLEVNDSADQAAFDAWAGGLATATDPDALGADFATVFGWTANQFAVFNLIGTILIEEVSLEIDDVPLVAGDRVLVKEQSNPVENGIYVVAAGPWTRAADYDDPAEVDGGDFVFVTGGTLYGDTGWVQTATGTVGVDALSFTQFSGAGTYLAGNGLTLDGNTFEIDATVTATRTYVAAEIEDAITEAFTPSGGGIVAGDYSSANFGMSDFNAAQNSTLLEPIYDPALSNLATGQVVFRVSNEDWGSSVLNNAGSNFVRIAMEGRLNHEYDDNARVFLSNSSASVTSSQDGADVLLTVNYAGITSDRFGAMPGSPLSLEQVMSSLVLFVSDPGTDDVDKGDDIAISKPFGLTGTPVQALTINDLVTDAQLEAKVEEELTAAAATILTQVDTKIEEAITEAFTPAGELVDGGVRNGAPFIGTPFDLSGGLTTEFKPEHPDTDLELGVAVFEFTELATSLDPNWDTPEDLVVIYASPAAGITYSVPNQTLIGSPIAGGTRVSFSQVTNGGSTTGTLVVDYAGLITDASVSGISLQEFMADAVFRVAGAGFALTPIFGLVETVVPALTIDDLVTVDALQTALGNSSDDILQDAEDLIAVAIAAGDVEASPSYKELNFNDVSRQFAVEVTGIAGDITTPPPAELIHSWTKADYSSAEFLVKVVASTSNGVSTELTKVLVTSSGSNFYVTEYGMINTTGDQLLHSIEVAEVTGSARLEVVARYPNTTVTVMGTLLV